jgi:hypothetical protein
MNLIGLVTEKTSRDTAFIVAAFKFQNKENCRKVS